MWEWLNKNRQKYVESQSYWTCEDDFKVSCLYRTLMGCKGAGIDLCDDTEMEEAWDAITSKDFMLWLDRDLVPSETPFHYEDNEWRRLAKDRLDKRKGYDKKNLTLPKRKKAVDE